MSAAAATFWVSWSMFFIAEMAAVIRSSSSTALMTAWCLFHLPVCSQRVQPSLKLASLPCVFIAIRPTPSPWAASIASLRASSPYLRKLYRNITDSTHGVSAALRSSAGTLAPWVLNPKCLNLPSPLSFSTFASSLSLRKFGSSSMCR